MDLPPLKPRVKPEILPNNPGIPEGFKSNFMAMIKGVKNMHHQIIKENQNKTLNESSKNGSFRPVDKTLEAYMLRKNKKYKEKQEKTIS